MSINNSILLEHKDNFNIFSSLWRPVCENSLSFLSSEAQLAKY